MYELEQITCNCYYVNSPTKVGIYETPEGVWLIDSGSDKDAGRRLMKITAERGLTIAGIIATHSHADHVGGAGFIQRRTGCPVYAPGIEAAFTRDPVLEPSFLFGAYPPKPLRGKAMMCPEPPVCEALESAPLPEGLKIIDLPGHFFNMIGVLTPEGVFYCADCVLSRTVLDKYHVGFVYDVKGALETLRALPGLGAEYYLPAHAELTRDISPLAELNAGKIRENLSLLVEICAEPRFFEGILKLVFDRLELTMDFSQYALVGSSVRSYLAYLLDAGELEIIFENNLMLWKRV